MFGEKRSPNGIKTKNNGIDFSTNVGEICYSVAEGEVSAIALVGIGKAVIINHGGFYTVYSGLENISVKKGDRVGLKQKIGVVVTSKTTLKTILHFEISLGVINSTNFSASCPVTSTCLSPATSHNVTSFTSDQ